jgi:hypothetical protein
MPCQTPVAFIIFNRPEITKMVFQKIREAQPTKLLVIADGPRQDRPDDIEKCALTRDIIKHVDWNCEVLTNFSDTNMGMGRREATGMDWIFSEVEEAIILEDDCLPTSSFFSFCEVLLATYRNDKRIMLISGGNFQNGISRTTYSYYFSKYPLTWGWASWRRAWHYYDYGMKSWPEFKLSGLLKFVCEDLDEQKYWTGIFDLMHRDPLKINTWDYQWVYACFAESGLCVTPDKNMISNIGFGGDSTNFKNEDDSHNLAKLPVFEIWDIKHPPFIVQNKEADLYDFEYTFEGINMRNSNDFLSRVRRKLSSIVKAGKVFFS